MDWGSERMSQGLDRGASRPGVRAEGIRLLACEIAERRSGRPSYLCDDEAWADALAEAKATYYETPKPPSPTEDACRRASGHLTGEEVVESIQAFNRARIATDTIRESPIHTGEGHHPDLTKTATGCHVWRGSTYGPCFKHGTEGCCLIAHASPRAQAAFYLPRCPVCQRFVRSHVPDPGPCAVCA